MKVEMKKRVEKPGIGGPSLAVGVVGLARSPTLGRAPASTFRRLKTTSVASVGPGVVVRFPDV